MIAVLLAAVAYVLIAGFVHRFVGVPEPDTDSLPPWRRADAYGRRMDGLAISAFWPVTFPLWATWFVVRWLFCFASGGK